MDFTAFVGPAYRVSNPIADVEMLMNLYPERMQSPGAKAPMVLNPTPGVTLYATSTQVGGKAIWSMEDRTFAVIGNTLFEVFDNGTTTSRGTMAVDANPATICSNGQGGGQLFITSGSNGYCYDLGTDTLTLELTGTATMAGMIDGYFVALDAVTSTIYVSDLLDGSSWDPTQFAQRSAAPDPWISMVVTRNYIYLLGQQTSEVWYDAGSFPFPFALAPGSSMAYGIAASFGSAVLGNSVIWLTHNADGATQVVQARGFTPVIVSDRGVEYAISTYDIVSDAEVVTYQSLGHVFFIVNFPSAGHTWAYDQTEGMWHERGTWDIETSEYDVWHAQAHAHAFGKHLVTDRFTGNIYELTDNSYTDFGGNVMRRVRRSPGINTENKWLRYSRFELYLRSGVGISDGQGEDPTVIMRFSNDGGHTWSNDLEAGAGAIGQYGTRVFWTRLGIARDRVWECVVSDPVNWQWVGAFIEAQPESRAA